MRSNFSVFGKQAKPCSGPPSVWSTWTTLSCPGSRSSRGSGAWSCSARSPSSTSSSCSTCSSPWWTTRTSSSQSARWVKKLWKGSFLQQKLMVRRYTSKHLNEPFYASLASWRSFHKHQVLGGELSAVLFVFLIHLPEIWNSRTHKNWNKLFRFCKKNEVNINEGHFACKKNIESKKFWMWFKVFPSALGISKDLSIDANWRKNP